MTTMEGIHYTQQPMPKRLVKRTKIKIDLYDVDIEVFIVNTSADVSYKTKQLCRKNKVGIEGVRDEACGYTASFPLSSGIFYLVLCMECMNVNTITHEADHLRAFIMDYRGMEDEEASANLSGFINEKIFKFLKNSNIEIK